MPYRLSALAERDLEEIWSYVAEDASPQPPTDSLTPSSTDSICWWSSRGWVVLVRSSALAFGRSQWRVTSSTTATRTSCWSLEYFMGDATRRRRGDVEHDVRILSPVNVGASGPGRTPSQAERKTTESGVLL